MPHTVCACVGGGSNAIGMFQAFLDDDVRLIGVEPAGKGLDTVYHGAPLSKGTPGCLHGSYSYCLQNQDGQISEAHSVSAGLDYPGVGPEHSYLKDVDRVTYKAITDDQALEAFSLLCKQEGILPAFESAHAIAQAIELSRELTKEDILLVNLSGRGDKDIHYFTHSHFTNPIL